MTIKQLWKFLNNSFYIAEMFDETEKLRCPFKLTPRPAALKRLEKLNASTLERLDAFIAQQHGNHFQKNDLSEIELFMLRLRYICGLLIVQAIMESEKDCEDNIFSFEASLDMANRYPFINLWHVFHGIFLKAAYDLMKRHNYLPYNYEMYDEVSAVMRQIIKLQKNRSATTQK